MSASKDAHRRNHTHTERTERPLRPLYARAARAIFVLSQHRSRRPLPPPIDFLGAAEKSRAEQQSARSGSHGVQEGPAGVLRPGRRRRRGGGAGGAGDAGGAAAAHGDEPAVAVAGGPVADAGHHQPARLHPGRAQVRDQELLHRQLPRRGRLRPRLQGVRRRRPPPRPRRAAGRRQVPRPRQRRRAGAPRVAGGGGVSGDAEPPAPGEAAGVLQPGRPPHARLRVHAPGQPREPPLQQSAGAAAMVDAAQDRRGRGQGAGLPARGRHPRHLPRLQGLQHPARLGLRGEAVGLRAGQGGAQGGRHARDDAGDGHARLRGAGVHPHGPPHGQERRLQLRGGAPGAAHGPALGRQAAARAGAEPRRLGAPLPAPRRRPAAPRHGPRHGVAVLDAGGARRRGRGALLPAERAQGAAPDARRRRRPRAAARARRRRPHGALRVHGLRAGGGGGQEGRRRGRRAGGRAGQVARQVGRARGQPAAQGRLLGHQRRQTAGEPAGRDMIGAGAEELRCVETSDYGVNSGDLFFDSFLSLLLGDVTSFSQELLGGKFCISVLLLSC